MNSGTYLRRRVDGRPGPADEMTELYRGVSPSTLPKENPQSSPGGILKPAGLYTTTRHIKLGRVNRGRKICRLTTKHALVAGWTVWTWDFGLKSCSN